MRARARRFAPLAAALLVTLGGCATGSAAGPDRTLDSTAPSTSAASTPSPTPASTAPRTRPTLRVRSRQSPVVPSRSSTHTTPSSSAPRTTPTPADPLPLSYRTGTATQLITVTASSSSSTDATLQTWVRRHSRWVKVDSPIHAYLGRSGSSENKHEGDGNTPAGSFTLTEAFGYKADPGTALPYFRTTPADWWISQPGSLYNTHQLCRSGTDGDGCGYASPSEHLYYTQPNYAYAVVIDYNTRNAGTVRAGAGSAVFLHVQTGKPTSGCVSVDRTQLVRILRWLQPSAHPRILIGVG